MEPDDIPQEPILKDGTPPKEDPAPDQGYGPNNEQLPEDLQDSLKEIVRTLETDDFPARLDEVKRIQKARLFWRGVQYVGWNEQLGQWMQIADHVGVDSGKPIDEMSPYQFVENIYRANGLTFIATMGGNMPKVNFHPQSPKNPDDVATANAATPISDFIFRNNRLEEADDPAWFLWTDGTVLSYTRWVTDGERFGFTDQPIMEPQPVQVGEPMGLCPSCGASVPAQAPEQVPPVCPQCGNPMGPEAFKPPETSIQPVQTGTEKVPNGQEVINFYGKMEVQIPSYARDFLDAPIVDLKTEFQRAKIKAIYPHVADKLVSSAPESDTDVRERIIRLALTSARRKQLLAGPGYEDLITFKRVWLRPWAFQLLKDKDKIAKLQALYPKGCYLALAGELYCESRNESMDDHWKVCHSMPGDGQMRDGVGFDLISVQEQHNTLVNIEADTHEHNIPTTYADTQVVNVPALQATPPAPGAIVPVQGRPGQPLQGSIYETGSNSVSPQLGRRRQELMGPTGQFLTGLFPAIFGGEMSGNDTASGYAMQRDQAMGRIGMVWRRYRRFIADTMELAVDCFRENRPQESEILILGENAKFESQMIHLDKLKGRFFAYPEASEDYPMSWAQKKNVIMALVQTGNPQLLQLLMSSPTAVEQFGSSIGISDFDLPGSEAREHQQREIAEMLQLNAVMVSPLDDHETHAAVGREWLESAEAEAAKLQNPQGYQMVFMHTQEHMNAISQQQMQAQQAQAQQQPPQQPQ